MKNSSFEMEKKPVNGNSKRSHQNVIQQKEIQGIQRKKTVKEIVHRHRKIKRNIALKVIQILFAILRIVVFVHDKWDKIGPLLKSVINHFSSFWG